VHFVKRQTPRANMQYLFLKHSMLEASPDDVATCVLLAPAYNSHLVAFAIVARGTFNGFYFKSDSVNGDNIDS
jgi:hypothetical protein